MDKGNAQQLAYFGNLISFVILGVALLVTHGLSGFLINKYHPKGYLLFVTKAAKWIMPFTLIAVLKTVNESAVLFFFIVSFMWILFLSPVYFIWKFYKNLTNTKRKNIDVQK